MISFNYNAEITNTKIVEAEGIKKAILDITVMNGEANQNGWRLKAERHNDILDEISGVPIKMQHASSDWEIIGTGISGIKQGNQLHAKIEITEPAAVKKFETKTWNTENMGVSPGLRVSKMVCSICDETVIDKNHEHQKNIIYKGVRCIYDVEGAHLKEISLTSDPAYRPYSGSINNITLTASLDKLLDNINEEKVDNKGDEDMVDKIAEAKLAAEVEAKAAADKLANDVATQLAELKEKELQASKIAEATAVEATAKAMELIEAQKKEIAAITARLIAQTKIDRTKELEAKNFAKEIIAEIVDKNLSQEDFIAEVAKVEKIIASVSVQKGSAPIDIKAEIAKTEAETCLIEFGVTEENLLAMVTDGQSHQIKI